jgi:hypothetical protein
MNVTVLAVACMLMTLWFSTAYANVYWWDGFESGNFSAWSEVQGQSTTLGGPGPQYVYVTTPAASGVPARQGSYFAHFQRPTSATAYPHAKIFKEWTAVGKKDQFGRVEGPIFNGGNVTAQYVAWYYFPSNYACTTSEWTNIFQFKEEGYNSAGVMSQNPSWWLNVGWANSFNGGGTQCLLFVNYQGNTYTNYHPKTMPLPLGRWIEVRAYLYQGDHIDWYVNGHLFDTSYNSTWPVGRYYYRSTGWILGVGHYLGYGTVFIDQVQALSIDTPAYK